MGVFDSFQDFRLYVLFWTIWEFQTSESLDLKETNFFVVEMSKVLLKLWVLKYVSNSK